MLKDKDTPSIESERCERTLEGHADSVNALAPLAGGRLASGSDDRTVRLWRVEAGELLATLRGHASFVLWLYY